LIFANLGDISSILKIISKTHITILKIFVLNISQKKLKSIEIFNFDSCKNKYAHIIDQIIQVIHNFKTIFLLNAFQIRKNLNKLFNK
jgi:hypothetical protein